MSTTNIFDEYEWRGMISDCTNGLRNALAEQTLTAYIGFDPTAASLHVGSLLPVMALARLQRCGHNPIAIAGGGTGLIGDPSGKTQERVLLTKDQVEKNLQGIKEQLSRFLDFDAERNPARMIDNASWLTTVTLMDFLRDIGKYFTVNYMLAKESVRRRLEQDDGISFTEFSYMLLQAYDFLILYDRCQCNLQMGGSDQWGNIVAGIELIRKLRGANAHGMVFPLVTTSSGVKFGKTEAGTIWLDPKLTSPFSFYQFWLNTDDKDVISYLKFFTWLPRNEIEALEVATVSLPEQREAQKRLAREVTEMMHGTVALQRAMKASEILFAVLSGAEITNLSGDEISDIFTDTPSSQLDKNAFAPDGIPMSIMLWRSGLASSRREAQRLIAGGGVYINNRRVQHDYAVPLSESIEGRFFVLRKGQKQYHLVQLVD